MRGKKKPSTVGHLAFAPAADRVQVLDDGLALVQRGRSRRVRRNVNEQRVDGRTERQTGRRRLVVVVSAASLRHLSTVSASVGGRRGRVILLRLSATRYN